MNTSIQEFQQINKKDIDIITSDCDRRNSKVSVKTDHADEINHSDKDSVKYTQYLKDNDEDERLSVDMNEKFDVPFKDIFFHFMKRRCFSIIIRIMSLFSLVPSSISIIKKYNRGHIMWSMLSILFLLLPKISASMFSLWCYVYEQQSDTLNYPKTNTKPVQSRRTIDISKGFKDNLEDVMNQSSDDYSEVESQNSHLDLKENNETAVNKKNKKIHHVIFDENLPTHKSEPKSFHGTYIESGLFNPKQTDQESGYNIKSIHKKIPGMKLKDFLAGIRNCHPVMIVFHFPLLMPRIYRFFVSSKKLWQYYENGHEIGKIQEALKILKKKYVKKLCVIEKLNQYFYECMITQHISTMICILETIPMTIIELFYWSVKASEIMGGEFSQQTPFLHFSIGDNSFNILELISILQSFCKVAFNISNLMHSVRMLDFSRQKMKLLHRIYLAMVYFFLILSRVGSCYLVMCLDNKGLLLGIILLVIHFFMFFIISKDLQMMEEEHNTITLIISSLLMIFVYVPPKSTNKISFISYQLMISVEMITIFLFGHYRILDSDATKLYLVGYSTEINYYYFNFAIAFGMFMVGSFLNLPVLQKKFFKYAQHVDREYIREALKEVNIDYDVNFELLSGRDGTYAQDKQALIAKHTIQLF